jgi:hypothetical protein
VLETYCRNGLEARFGLVIDVHLISVEVTYKKPTKVLSVEIEAELKAEHCVDPESEMQLCAVAAGAAARIDSSALLMLSPIDLCFRLLEIVCPRVAIEGSRDVDDDTSTSTVLALSAGGDLPRIVEA